MSLKIVLFLILFNISIIYSQPQIEWTKRYDFSFLDDYGWCVQQTNDSGYIISGWVLGYCLLIKTDINGDTLWTRMYKKRDGNYAYSIKQSLNG